MAFVERQVGCTFGCGQLVFDEVQGCFELCHFRLRLCHGFLQLASLTGLGFLFGVGRPTPGLPCEGGGDDFS